MKRIARVNGNVRVICTGDELTVEQHAKIFRHEKEVYPLYLMGHLEFVPVTIQNGNHFNLTVGEKYNDLEDWSFTQSKK